MSRTKVTLAEDGRLRVQGDLVFATVAGVLREGERLFAGRKALTIDLAAVEKCDSAALALLLEWLQRGRAQGVEIQFEHLPSALRGIAQLSNVEALLPLAG
jgi:phospholipid transport system transporter-binding protein